MFISARLKVKGALCNSFIGLDKLRSKQDALKLEKIGGENCWKIYTTR